jgi:hypothetical protein
VVEVEQWAEIRRMHFVLGVSIKAIARRRGRDRNERLQDFAERSFEPGRTFANELDYQLQLDA